jgi:signal transduction histidine kinase
MSSIRTLVDLNQVKDRFLGIAAHDLRNPLTSIRGLSEILLTEATGTLTEEQREYIAIINSAADGMLRLVSDLLDVSVIESGNLELHVEEQSLCKLIKERVRIHRVLAEKKGIILHEMLAALPAQVFDASKIAQVIDNLLSNAIKFSGLGSHIFVRLQEQDGASMASVRDEGPGIPPEAHSRIFGEFQYLNATSAGGEKSIGLGLAIAKRIIEAHSGTLAVDSIPGSGSTFSFSLPMGNANDTSDKTPSIDCRR